MRYEQYSYLWMPRPDNAVPKAMLASYQAQGWVAQVKLNGTANIMAISPDREKVVAATRHNDAHKMWSPSPHTLAPFKGLPGDGWYIFTCELMYSKVPGIRDINYIHDILVADGEYLVGSTFSDRQVLLRGLWNVPENTDCKSHDVIDDHTWLAKNHVKGFSKLFESLDRPEYEGLVLKRPTAKLAHCSRQTSNNSWQLKIRAPKVNFGF